MKSGSGRRQRRDSVGSSSSCEGERRKTRLSSRTRRNGEEVTDGPPVTTPVREIAKPPKKRRTNDITNNIDMMDQQQPPVTTETEDIPQSRCLHLNEWVDGRVLVKKDGVYRPAVIKNVLNQTSIVVQLEHSDEFITYDKVLSVNNVEIISDDFPSIAQLQIGSSVCVRDNSVYIPGKIIDKSKQSTNTANSLQFHVVFDNRHPDRNTTSVCVSKPSLRLIKPPWHEELEQYVRQHSYSRPTAATRTSPGGSSSTNASAQSSSSMVESSGGVSPVTPRSGSVTPALHGPSQPALVSEDSSSNMKNRNRGGSATETATGYINFNIYFFFYFLCE